MLSRRHFLQGVAATTAGLTAGASSAPANSLVRVKSRPGEVIGDTLRAAIEKAHPSGRIELVFPEGEHILSEGPASTDGPNPGTFAAELVFDRFGEVIVRGEGAGATLLFSDFKRGAFRFLHCDSVTISNVSIDWPRPPFSTAEVTACEGANIEVRVDDDFPLDQRLAVTSVIRYDPETRAPSPMPGAVMYYHVPPENTVFLKPQRLRITLPEKRDLSVGTLLSLQHAQYGFDGFHFWHCRQVRIADTTVYTCPGMAFHGHSCHDLTMLRCSVVPSDRQRRRLHSSTADGSHFVNFSGRVELTECTFANTGDDCNNTWGSFMYVVDRIGDRELRITHQGTAFMFPQKVEPGDILEFIGSDLAAIARIEIEQAVVEKDPAAYRVRLKNPLPPAIQKGAFLFDASRLPSLRIRKCRCLNTRGRGFLVTTRDAVVEDCVFDRLQNGGILAFSMMQPWFQAAGLDGLTIRRNTFTHCNQGIGPCCGDIMIGAVHENWTHGAAGVNRTIRIIDNTIRDTGNLWLQIGSTDGAVIEGNTIVNSNVQEPHVDWMKAAIALVNTRSIRFRSNQFSWTRGKDERFTFWDIQHGVDRDTLIVEDNQGFAPLPDPADS